MQWYYSELAFSAAFYDSKSGANGWAGVAIGPAAADRIVVVATSDQAGTPISAVTVGGISATRRVTNSHTQIWTASVPTGTTATINVTSSSGTLNGVGVYSLYGLTSEVPAFTAMGTISVSLDVNSGGFAIASFSVNGSGTPVWTVVTKDYSSVVSGNTFSSASGLFSSAQTLSITESGIAGTQSMAAASWGPT